MTLPTSAPVFRKGVRATFDNGEHGTVLTCRVVGLPRGWVKFHFDGDRAPLCVHTSRLTLEG